MVDQGIGSLSQLLYNGVSGLPVCDEAVVTANKTTISSISSLLAQQNKDCFSMKLNEKLEEDLRCLIM